MNPTDKPFQFGIRHLLEAMFVMSLVAALLAPWVRGWSAGQWRALGLQSGIVALTFALTLGGNAWTRHKARISVGEIHFRIRFKTWGHSAWRRGWSYLPLGCATYLLLLLTVAIAVEPRDGPRFIPLVPIVLTGLFAAVGVGQLLYRPDQILIGERGIAVSGRRFVPWEQVAFVYEPDHCAAPLFLKITGWAFELIVPPELEVPLAEFLAQHAKPWVHPPQRRKVPLS